MGNFGVELIVVNDRSIMNRTSPEIVTSRILQAVDSTPPSYLYFHPREYRVSSVNPIDGSPLLPLVNVVGMGNVRALIFPERHTLWFARGAVLSLAPGVVLIIRGSIIADPTQIFDLPEVRARQINPTSTEPAGTALVRFESTRIEEIYPEWFGVVPGFSSTTPAYASASAAAYQACLHAAVRDRDRDGVSLPPLTVVSNGVYSVNETLEALPDVNGRGALWMSGSGDATRRGLGIPSLNRYPRGASQWAREPNALEDDRSALLRLHPKVSAEISGVGFRCFEFAAGDRSKRDVAHALLIEEATMPDLDPLVPGRHVRLERCGLTGGREAVVGLKAGLSEGRPTGSSGVRSTRPRARVSRRAARYSMGSRLSLRIARSVRPVKQVVTRAAQSVLLASRIALTGNRAEIVVPSPLRTRGMTTVIFGLQCVAALFALLSCIGCQRGEPSSPADAGSDLGAVAKPDAPPPNDSGIGHRVDTGARLDARPRPDLVFEDPPDAGAVEDAPTIDAPVLDAPLDAPLQDVFVDIPRYIDPQWAMEDVIRRDIEVAPLPDAAFVEDFGPARQMRASCPAVTDGDERIAPPRLLFPMSPMRATSQRPTLFWSLPPGVDGARIELCRDRCCTQRIATLDVTGSSARPPQALPPGVVFWRARGRIGARVGRDTSFTWEFGVKHRDAPTDTAWGTIKDFNGDGYDDLVDAIYSSSRPSQTRIYWGAEDGLHDSRFQALSNEPASPFVRIGDFNGDGLADALINTGVYYYTGSDGERRSTGRTRVIYGESGGARAGGMPFRTSILEMAVDDFNGDGFSDMAARVGGYPTSTQIRTGRTLVVFGGPGGLGDGGQQTFDDPQGERLRSEYGACGSAGDLNGDGYADLLVGDPSYPSSRGTVYVFAGSALGVGPTVATRIEANAPAFSPGVSAGIGRRLGLIGDVDGDRVGDVVIGASFLRSLAFYRGSRDAFLEFTVSVMPSPRDQTPGGSFGTYLSIAPDLDGDGRADPVLSCPGCGPEERIDPEYGRGYVYVYRHSSDSWLGGTPTLVLRGEDRLWDRGATFGLSSAAGDYNGDGFDDLAIGDTESFLESFYPRRGKVFLVFGGVDLTRLRVVIVHGESPFDGQSSGLGGGLATIGLSERRRGG